MLTYRCQHAALIGLARSCAGIPAGSRHKLVDLPVITTGGIVDTISNQDEVGGACVAGAAVHAGVGYVALNWQVPCAINNLRSSREAYIGV